MKKPIVVVAVAVAILAAGLMSGCSSEPSKPATAEKPQPKAPEAITGSSAFYKCYISARGWAQDAQPYRVESQPATDSKGRDGKAGEWRAGFASPSQRATRPYTWANGDISHGVEDTYSPTNSSTQVSMSSFSKWIRTRPLPSPSSMAEKNCWRKNPTRQFFYGQGLCRRLVALRRKVAGERTRHAGLYVLDWNRQTNELLWHVIYGTDRDTAKLRVAVNASTGEFSRVEK